MCIYRVSDRGHCKDRVHSRRTPVPPVRHANTRPTAASPPWHRRRRQQRAKARRSIWAARSRGLPGPRRAALLLLRHHTAPVYRELMGRGKDRQAAWTESYDAYGSWPRESWHSKAAGKSKAAQPRNPSRRRWLSLPSPA